MNHSRILSPLALTLSLLACEPVSPLIEGGPAPADGVWEMEVIAVDSLGRCGLEDDSDLRGLTMSMQVDTRDEHGIRFELEGLRLKGYVDSGWMHAEGTLSGGSTVEVEVEVGVGDDPVDAPTSDEDETGHDDSSHEGSDGRSRESGDDDYRPASGLYATLEGWTLSRDSMEGELTVEYNMPDMQCVLILEFEAEHMGRGDRDEPVSVDPKADPEKSDDEPYETDEG